MNTTTTTTATAVGKRHQVRVPDPSTTIHRIAAVRKMVQNLTLAISSLNVGDDLAAAYLLGLASKQAESVQNALLGEL